MQKMMMMKEKKKIRMRTRTTADRLEAHSLVLILDIARTARGVTTPRQFSGRGANEEDQHLLSSLQILTSVLLCLPFHS
jgi:hypothetical protein